MSIHNETSIPRKRNQAAAEEAIELDRRPFVIKDSSDPFARPSNLAPLCLLSRAQLPLAFLDTATSGSRIFTTHVRALESSHDHGGDATVLVAKETSGSRLYAIERVQARCYALCKLGVWVTESEVKDRSKVILHSEEREVKRQALVEDQKHRPWWKLAAADVAMLSKEDIQPGPELPRLAMRRVMEAPQKTAKGTKIAESKDIASDTAKDAPIPEMLAEERHASSQDVLKELAKQYLEALYISRMSLAYFTKGPLSRARAAFTTPESESYLNELLQFLRDCVLTSSTMDKKYKDGVPDTIKALPNPDSKSPAKTPDKPVRRKKRKWKPKRDKDGFFVDEHEYIERWWHTVDENEPNSSSSENVEDSIRRRVAKIRNRETFLQIVLVLEVLALESTNSPIAGSKTNVSDSQYPRQQHADAQHTPEPKNVKPKKKQDLPALLETLLDKLCIWQSLQSNSPAKSAEMVEGKITDGSNDELQSFCVEVITPFFSSRIPQYASIVNKKLGGPTAPSPIKRKSSTNRKPGQPAVRQPPEKKARQPLVRVSTELLNQSRNLVSNRPPSLHRSATDPETTLHIKREGSEVSMDSIPFVQPNKLPQSRRSSIFSREAPQLKAFSKREVDLTAISASNEAKMRKKKDVEAKLKEAVEMLKKPNRALAVKEMEDRTDETFAKAISKSKNGNRVSMTKATTGASTTLGMGRNSHVASTPKHVRTVKATPHKSFGILRTANSHSTALVNSSTSFVDDQAFVIPTSTPAIPQTGHRPRIARTVQETPSRGFAKFMPAGLARLPGTLESPVSNRRVALEQQTPCKPSLQPAVQPLVAASPNITRMQETAGAPKVVADANGDVNSIYDALGWNDEYEELT